MEFWLELVNGVGYFLNLVFTAVWSFCVFNPLCLAFLSVTFVGLGVHILKRAVFALGRGSP